MYDYILKNALIADGSGSPLYRANIATFASKIVFIGREDITRAKNIIDASSYLLTPGFIDIHAHTELELLRHRDALVRLKQGITTDITGNCGIGTFPASEALKESSLDVLGPYESWSWSDYSSFKATVLAEGIGSNIGYLASHSGLRYAVLGDNSARAANNEEVSAMCSLLSESLDSGALGFSTGLYYAPCLFATDEELESLLRVVASKNKLFSVHHRCEGDDILDSVRAVIALAEKTGVRIEISHLKAIGGRNQEKVDELLAIIDSAHSRGVDVAFDQYPYTFGSTSLSSLLPPSILALSPLERRFALSLENARREIRDEMLQPNGWDSIYSLVGPEKIFIQALPSYAEYEGRSLAEIGELRGEDPLSSLFDILAEERGLSLMSDITTSDENLYKIMRHPLSSFGSDGLYSSERPHIRSFEAAPTFLLRAQERAGLSVEETVRKLTGFNADKVGLQDKGYIREGMDADLLLIDQDRLKEDGRGIDYVFVNGELALLNGQDMKIRNGRVVER